MLRETRRDCRNRQGSLAQCLVRDPSQICGVSAAGKCHEYGTKFAQPFTQKFLLATGIHLPRHTRHACTFTASHFTPLQVWRLPTISGFLSALLSGLHSELPERHSLSETGTWLLPALVSGEFPTQPLASGNLHIPELRSGSVPSGARLSDE